MYYAIANSISASSSDASCSILVDNFVSLLILLLLSLSISYSCWEVALGPLLLLLLSSSSSSTLISYYYSRCYSCFYSCCCSSSSSPLLFISILEECFKFTFCVDSYGAIGYLANPFGSSNGNTLSSSSFVSARTLSPLLFFCSSLLIFFVYIRVNVERFSFLFWSSSTFLGTSTRFTLVCDILWRACLSPRMCASWSPRDDNCFRLLLNFSSSTLRWLAFYVPSSYRRSYDDSTLVLLYALSNFSYSLWLYTYCSWSSCYVYYY